jgi:hypothetical protein
MMLLATWRREEGQRLGQNAFDSLIKLIRGIVTEPGFQPQELPKSFHAIEKCEKLLDIIVCVAHKNSMIKDLILL